MSYYIGLMSGTSLDGIDSVVISFDNDNRPQLIETDSITYPEDLHNDLLKLIESQEGKLKLIGTLDAKLGQLYAYTANKILHKASLSKKDVIAIGCHGQTIYHYPNDFSPFSWQLGNMHIIARQTGITTIGDFRSLDLAYNGQGAPLAPAFHKAVFSSKTESRVIVNIGGIANISCLNTSNDEIIGFDTGPGNALLDAWFIKHHSNDKNHYDDQGKWAQSGNVIDSLLNQLLKDHYFVLPPPKSTGKEYFNLNWLENYLANLNDPYAPNDIQATLSELTALSIANAIKQVQPDTKGIYLAGGGSNNIDLVNRIQNHLHPINIQNTASLGIDTQWVEASLIAWLAMMRLEHRKSNLPSVTGASEQLSLGVIYLPY